MKKIIVQAIKRALKSRDHAAALRAVRFMFEHKCPEFYRMLPMALKRLDKIILSDSEASISAAVFVWEKSGLSKSRVLDAGLKKPAQPLAALEVEGT